MPPDTPKGPRLITLICMAGIGTIGLNLILPSLPTIARDLGGSLAQLSIAVSGYLAATAVVQLTAGPLSDRIGRRPVTLGALGIFIAASVVCALAQTLWLFLVARLIQASVVTCFAMSLAITRDTLPPAQAAARLGTIMMFMGLAPLLGPMLGGVIDETLGWRASFWVFAIAGLALFAWCLKDLTETRARIAGQSQNAMLLFGDPRFWAFALTLAFSLGVFFTFIACVPIVGAAALGLSPSQIGIGIGSITIGYVLGSAVTSRIASRVQITHMVLAGRSIAFLGLSTGLLVLLILPISPMVFFGFTILAGFGNGISMPPANAGITSVRPELAGTAAGASGALSVSVGAVLTGLSGPFIAAAPSPERLMAMLTAIAALALIAAFAAFRLSRA